MLIKGSNLKVNSLKDSLILILSSTWPLKIKQIHNLLKKEYKQDVTYQAVHKAINELKESNIVIEIENGWQLSLDWLNESYNFFHEIKDKYKKHPFFNSLEGEGNITSINFKNLIEFDNFYFTLFENIIADSKAKTAIFCMAHNWRPLLYPQKENEVIQKNADKIYFVCSGETSLDLWCSDFEKKSGAQVKNQKDYTNVSDIYIIKDLIIQIYFPRDLMEKINILYSSKKDASSIDINNTIKNIFEESHKIIIVITRNIELAKQSKERIFELFITKEESNNLKK